MKPDDRKPLSDLVYDAQFMMSKKEYEAFMAVIKSFPKDDVSYAEFSSLCDKASELMEKGEK